MDEQNAENVVFLARILEKWNDFYYHLFTVGWIKDQRFILVLFYQQLK